MTPFTNPHKSRCVYAMYILCFPCMTLLILQIACVSGAYILIPVYACAYYMYSRVSLTQHA
jgi:hypothetical protein